MGQQRIVILGKSGFVAKNLVAQLGKTKIDSFALSKEELNLASDESVLKLGKILCEQDVLVITSALTPDKGKDRATMLTNIAMANSVAGTLENVAPKQVILISSDAVYADSLSLISESSPTDPTSLYGVGHITREKIITEVCSRRKIPLLILRPSAMYGRGDTHNSYGPNRFAKSALESAQVQLFGDGSDKRDHLFIDDLCRVIIKSIESGLTGVLNVASGRALSFREVAQEISGKLSGKIKIETQSAGAAATFRHFDVTALIKKFPALKLTPIEVGIDTLLEQ